MTKKSLLSTVIILFVIGSVYLVLRSFHILSLPIFTDEAIYVRWAQIAQQDANWRFISLTDGKQPSFIWAGMIFLKFFQDPLMAVRMVSVMAGLGTVIGLFFLGREVFKNVWVGVIASILYVLFPMAMVHDRMALYDSTVALLGVWALYIEILLVKRIRLDIALILGMVLGVGLLTKTNSFFNIYLSPLLLLLFDWKKKLRTHRLVRFAGYMALSSVLAYAFYSILRLSPFYHIIDEKNAIFVYPLREWIHHPFTYFFGNFTVLLGWLTTYLTWPFICITIGGLIISRKELWAEKVLLFLWFLAPFTALALFGRVIYPRHMFFMTMPLLVLGAYAIYKILYTLQNNWMRYAVIPLAVCVMVYTDILVLTNISKAPIPQSDLNQYVNDWPAGNGVKQSVEFFRQQAQNKKLYIATGGTFGLMPYALEIYLVKNPNITIEGYWPVSSQMPEKIKQQSKTIDTYVVLYQPCPDCKKAGDAPKDWPLQRISSYQQGVGNAYYTIYKVVPQ